MAAVFHDLGRCFLFARNRLLYTYSEGSRSYVVSNSPQDWYFIGTAVTAPDVEIEKIISSVTTDKLGPAPENFIYHSENHIVSVTLNFLDYTNYMKLKARAALWDGIFQRKDKKSQVGTLMVPVEDVELLLLWDVLSGATDTPEGRKYYSATPISFRETTENTRILEAGISFRCIPILRKEIIPPPPPPPQSTPIKIVIEPPTPISDFTYSNPYIYLGGLLPPIYLPFLDLANNSFPSKQTETIISPSSQPSFADVVNRIDQILNPNGTSPPPPPGGGRIETEIIPPTPPVPSNSPIPSDNYLYYLYTEIPDQF